MSKFLATVVAASALAMASFTASAEAVKPPCKCAKCAKDCKACCGEKCGDCCKGGECKGCKPKSSVDATGGYIMASCDKSTSGSCGSK
jgi:hypothetical protein